MYYAVKNALKKYEKRQTTNDKNNIKKYFANIQRVNAPLIIYNVFVCEKMLVIFAARLGGMRWGCQLGNNGLVTKEP